MKYTVGHPAYSGANRYAEFNTPEGVYVELLERDVSETDARNVRLQLRYYPETMITVWTHGQRDVIEVKAHERPC